SLWLAVGEITHCACNHIASLASAHPDHPVEPFFPEQIVYNPSSSDGHHLNCLAPIVCIAEGVDIGSPCLGYNFRFHIRLDVSGRGHYPGIDGDDPKTGAFDQTDQEGVLFLLRIERTNNKDSLVHGIRYWY